ncbi:helix-turn-helix transcriptional regulator [Sodalis endosymbiont of Spalangia cameroni]|uniref:helix-turn-helix domain-containing protein n=1 Tax=Sodalis praecaptivus TaxID=1239307 RepID=UPI0031F9E5A3
MNIGKAIRLCRTQRGMSQGEVARIAGCSVSYLSMLENNKRDPTLSTIEKISYALRVPLGMLFFLGADAGELQGIDKSFQSEVAITVLDLLNE